MAATVLSGDMNQRTRRILLIVAAVVVALVVHFSFVLPYDSLLQSHRVESISD